MKKRIISLILVVASVFLTLTGCAYNYAKDDMLEYTTDFDKDAFLKAIKNLEIDADDSTIIFGTDETGRWNNVADTIAKEIYSSITDKTAYLIAGQPGQYDYVFYYYYITDDEGHIFSASKMNWDSASSIQLGATSLKDNATLPSALISSALLGIADIKDYIYTSSEVDRVANSDIITVSYKLTYLDDRNSEIEESADNKYLVIDSDDMFHQHLIGERVGVSLDDITFSVDETFVYSDITVTGTDDTTLTALENGQTVLLSYKKTHVTSTGTVTDETVTKRSVILNTEDALYSALIGSTLTPVYVQDDQGADTETVDYYTVDAVSVPKTVEYKYTDVEIDSLLYANSSVLEGDVIYVTYTKYDNDDYTTNKDNATVLDSAEAVRVTAVSSDEFLAHFIGQTTGTMSDIVIPHDADYKYEYSFEFPTLEDDRTVLQAGDVIVLTYTKTNVLDATDVETVTEVETTLSESDQLHNAIIGTEKPEDTTAVSGEVTVTEISHSDLYTGVSFYTDKFAVLNGYTVYISYNKEYAPPSDGAEPADNSGITTDTTSGNWVETVTYERVTLDASDPFHAYLIGKSVGSVANVDLDLDGDADGEKETTFKNIKIHYIVEGDVTDSGIEVKYTPYPDAAEEGSEDTLTDVYGIKHAVNEKELTYHIFPAYYLDVEELTPELIVEKYSSALKSTTTEGDETVYKFATVQASKALQKLIDDPDISYGTSDSDETRAKYDLVALVSYHNANTTAVTTALKNLTSAQSSLYKEQIKTNSNADTLEELEEKLAEAEEEYLEAVAAAAASEAALDAKIANILAINVEHTETVEGESVTTVVSFASTIIGEYEEYKYGVLEASYESALSALLGKEIYALASEIKFDTLPKKAVKEAYKSIINEYEYSFYEDTVSTGETDEDGNTVYITNYKKYNGSFDDYLISAVNSGISNKEYPTGISEVYSVEQAEDAIQRKAEESVKELMLMYLLVDVIGEDKVGLTKEEKKQYEENYEAWKSFYESIGYTYPYTLEATLYAAQFDKIFDYLLETGEKDGNTIVYKNIGYTLVEAADE